MVQHRAGAAAGHADSATEYSIELDQISKRFGGVNALQHVSLRVRRGTAHAIVGENGAGKSTIGKIIGGVHRADSGTLRIFGRAVEFHSPAEALDQGVAIMEQEIALAPDRNVIENVLLGSDHTLGLLPVQHSEWDRRFAQLIEDTGFELDPYAMVGDLPIQEQQLVELLRALARDAKVIVMDEPTAALPRTDVERLHRLIRRLVSQGVTVVLVSHFLDEVLELCDSVSVMRSGRHISTHRCNSISQEGLISEMLGVELEQMYPHLMPRPHQEQPLLKLNGISDERLLRGIDIEVHSGEIVGLYGLVGSGRTETLQIIAGASHRTGGAMEFEGSDYAPRSPREALSAGVSYLPESRKDDGLFLELSQRMNVLATIFEKAARFFGIDRRSEARTAWNALAEVQVDRIVLDMPVNDMSGGNQQKVLLGKVLQSSPTLLLLDEPTRGVDLGARKSLYETILSAVQRGASVLLVSSDLDEILNMSHRVYVLRRGRVVGERPSGLDRHDEVLRLAFGTEPRREESP